MRRWGWVLFGFLAIALAASSYWGYQQYDARNQLRITVANQYQRSFYNLIDYVENVEVSLAKGIASTSPQGNIPNLAQVWAQASQALANLTQLPLAREKALRTAKFLNQVGDYAYTMMRKNTSGQEMSGDDLSKLKELSSEATYLSEELHKVQRDVDEGKVNWAEVHDELRQASAATKEMPGVEGFNRIDQGMQEYPTLIYDGPFSDHIETAKPKGLTGPEVDADTAKQKAIEFVPDNLQRGASAEKTGEIQGRISGYSYAVAAGGEDQKRTVDVDVSKQGGHIITMINYRDVDKTNMSLEDAAKKGQEFLASRGFENMVPTFATNEDNVAVIPYVYVQDDVLIYPDLMKVKVAMDDGEVLGFEALTYWMSHRERDLPEPKLTHDEAVAKVTQKLKEIETRLALIPLESLREVLCWEVKGEMMGEPYIVYINAESGYEERILKLIEDDNGIRTQ